MDSIGVMAELVKFVSLTSVVPDKKPCLLSRVRHGSYYLGVHIIIAAPTSAIKDPSQS